MLTGGRGVRANKGEKKRSIDSNKEKAWCLVPFSSYQGRAARGRTRWRSRMHVRIRMSPRMGENLWARGINEGRQGGEAMRGINEGVTRQWVSSVSRLDTYFTFVLLTSARGVYHSCVYTFPTLFLSLFLSLSFPFPYRDSSL